MALSEDEICAELNDTSRSQIHVQRNDLSEQCDIAHNVEEATSTNTLGVYGVGNQPTNRPTRDHTAVNSSVLQQFRQHYYSISPLECLTRNFVIRLVDDVPHFLIGSRLGVSLHPTSRGITGIALSVEIPSPKAEGEARFQSQRVNVC